MAATHRLVVESLEDRRVLSANSGVVTDKLVSVQQVSTGSLAVEMEVTDTTSSGGTATNAAPQATGVVEISISGAQFTVALPSAFSDLETDSADLVFSVIGNTNPGMFGNLTLNADGDLVMDILADADDLATLTIQATDGDGGIGGIDLDVVGIGDDEAALTIDSFTGFRDPNDPEQWTFAGEISGADDNSDVTIEFGGDLAGESTDVEPDGSFDFTGIINTESSSGHVTVQAISGSGQSSGIFIFDLDDDD